MWLDIEQNSQEWLQARSGKLTGSAISKVMANYGKAFGEPAKKLAVNIAIEQITGKPIESNYTNEHMERGHEQEPIARMQYESEFFCDVDNGGFFDNGLTGCSPDGLVSANGIIEIKSVIAHVQYATLKRNDIDPSYKWQTVFNLKESGKEWLDYVSFCAEFPVGNQLIVHRIYAEQKKDEFKMMDSRIAEFSELIDAVIYDINGNVISEDAA